MPTDCEGQNQRYIGGNASWHLLRFLRNEIHILLLVIRVVKRVAGEYERDGFNFADGRMRNKPAVPLTMLRI
jgi:hypothetical protein